ncbi:MAG TPA: TolC family protein [Candidatus Aminicenantes bacterium]|nr:TolC family protein [Candidatus Aminicenantes bacterium]HRY63837.1 TolC family protein [Candidatus Aminicenantes bacterium]HRZ70750.1 TolC family protein [Candidatus Aminicenantes bacterium]
MAHNSGPIRGRRPAAVALGLFVALAPLAAAQDKPLTLDEAVSLALERNERALAARESVNAADARVAQARSFFLPTISSTGTYTRRAYETRRVVGGAEVIMQRYNALSETLALSQSLFDARSLTSLSAVRAQRNADMASAAESRRQLAFEVSQAFLATLGTTQVREASARRFAFAGQNLAAAKARFSAGLASVNDVTRAELEYATAEVGLTQVKGEVETSTLQLGNLLAAPEAVRNSLVVPDFLIEAASAEAADAEALIEEALARRLDIGALRWTASAQRSLAKLPMLGLLPSLSATGQYRLTNEASFNNRNWNWSVGATLNWTIFDGLTRLGQRKEQKALARLADLDVQAAGRRVDLEVRQALVSLANQRASLKQASVAHEVAKKNAAETTELYRQGLASALEVADANVSLFEAEVAFVQERYGLGVAFLSLEAALGLDPFGKEPRT